MESYRFERIDENNLPELVRLVETVTDKPLSLPQYQQKYNTPWGGGKYHGWVARDTADGQLVAVVAALPFGAVLPGGRQVPMSHIIETFTLPEHQGRGLMTLLAQKTIEDQKKLGVRLFYAIANQHNEYGFVQKLGFARTVNLTYYTLDIRTFPLEAICRRLHFPGVFRWWADKVITPYLAPRGFALQNSVLTEGYAGVLHDLDFYNYKSFTFNRLFRFAGIDSWLKMETGLLVGDVLLPENCTDEQFDEWWLTLLSIARRAGLRKIIFQANPLTRMSEKLSDRLPAHTSWTICCLASDAEIQRYVPLLRFGYGDLDTF